MARIDQDIHKLKYPGAVDADGHMMEAPDLWEKYAEAKYKAIAVRLRRDAAEGDYLEVQGRPSKIARRGVFTQSVMGRVSREKENYSARVPMEKIFRWVRWTPGSACSDSTLKACARRSCIPPST